MDNHNMSIYTLVLVGAWQNPGCQATLQRGSLGRTVMWPRARRLGDVVSTPKPEILHLFRPQ